MTSEAEDNASCHDDAIPTCQKSETFENNPPTLSTTTQRRRRHVKKKGNGTKEAETNKEKKKKKKTLVVSRSAENNNDYYLKDDGGNTEATAMMAPPSRDRESPLVSSKSRLSGPTGGHRGREAKAVAAAAAAAGRRGGGGWDCVRVTAVILSIALLICWTTAAVIVLADPSSYLVPDKNEMIVEGGGRRFLRLKSLMRRKNRSQKLDNVNDASTSNHDSVVSANTKTRKRPDISQMDTPLLVFTCSRPDYLRRTLDAVWKYHPLNPYNAAAHNSDENSHQSASTSFTSIGVGSPIIISQDGTDQEVQSVIQEFQNKFQNEALVPFIHLTHPKHSPNNNKKNLRGNDAYKALAVHYGWALTKVFNGEAYYDIDNRNSDKQQFHDLEQQPQPQQWLPLPKHVIILEEDIEISVDFFSYMNATAPLLDTDPTLLAVSAFNDNGKVGLVSNPTRLLRSDFFPGLGWMLSRTVWEELRPKWPPGWWDDWLREPNQRRNRQIIRPEISRTFHFGIKSGASRNWFGTHLAAIQLNTANVQWSTHDLSYLRSETFQNLYLKQVKDAQPVSSVTMALQQVTTQNVRLEYHTWKEFQSMARELQLMDDEKAKVPRTGYMGIVETRRPSSQKNDGDEDNNGFLIFLSPPLDQVQVKMLRGRVSS